MPPKLKSIEETPPPPPITLSDISLERSDPQNASTTPDVISFRYAWPLKITKRLLSPNEPPTILQVSPAFCTAFNGVQFVWCMRMCDENCLQEMQAPDRPVEQRVNVSLYYKDGPSQDVSLESCR
jgi:hypothetical protein